MHAPDGLCLPLCRCDVQRRPAVVVALVEVHPLQEVPPERRQVARVGGEQERRHGEAAPLEQSLARVRLLLRVTEVVEPVEVEHLRQLLERHQGTSTVNRVSHAVPPPPPPPPARTRLGELDPAHRVPYLVQRGRPQRDGHQVGHHQHYVPAHAGLAGEADLNSGREIVVPPSGALHLVVTYQEGKLPRVVVHPAAVHEREDVPDTVSLEDLLPGYGTDAPVGQRRSHHGEGLGVHLEGAKLVMQDGEVN